VRQAVASCSGSCPPTTCTFLGTSELTPDQLSTTSTNITTYIALLSVSESRIICPTSHITMVCNQQYAISHASIDKLPSLARSTRRRKHAHRSHHRLPLLHYLDSAYGTLPLVFYFYAASSSNIISQPFVDSSHPSQSLFPPRVWAIRIPVILILVGGAVVGSFLSLIMIKSNRQKALKAQKVKAK
jgi:dolichyl-phosphate mannosyltransferase polypeptide 2 regulatory subunit